MQPEVLYGLGALILVIALYMGVRMNRTRNKANDKVTDAAVKASYRDPEGYDPKAFEKQLK